MSGTLAPQEERSACPTDSADPDAKIVETVGAVVCVQFEDRSTWGDFGAGQQVLAARPKRLVPVYRSHKWLRVFCALFCGECER
jgi:hypothetical protein